MSTTTCPECAADIELEAGTEENEIIVCPDCGVDLEVTSLIRPRWNWPRWKQKIGGNRREVNR